MSARWSTSSPRNCSGAMYSSVPTMEPAIVRPAVWGFWGSSTPGFPGARRDVADRAIPKSMMRAWSVPVSTMMLAGLRSRWTTPAWCAARSPDTTPRATVSTCSTGRPPSFFFRIEESSTPSTYGIVMYLMPSISPMSWMRTTFGWVTCRASRSSRLNRFSRSRAASGSLAISGRTILSATPTPSSSSQARYTAPIPPSPRSRMMW